VKEFSVLGIDLAKQSFSVCAMTKNGKVVLRKTISRKALVEFTVKIPPTLIAFEACGGSHYWARVFSRQGHEVKMMAIHHVKRFMPPQKKNDAADAEAICAAALREDVPSVREKGVDQQNVDILLNFREQLVKSRVALTNQIHAIGLEYGVALPKTCSTSKMEKIFEALEDGSNELSGIARDLIQRLIKSAKKLEEESEKVANEIKQLLGANENFKLLNTIPGIGPMTAAALIAHTGGSVKGFNSSRQFAASLGLTPRQYSTGGKTKLGGITRSGDATIRRLLVVGSTSVMRVAEKKSDKVSTWVTGKRKTIGYRKASVAMANKTARIAYAVLKNQKGYQYQYAS
jgi:transposase